VELLILESIGTLFNEYFKIIPSVSTQSVSELTSECHDIAVECQKIRYQVYCLEQKFEREEDHPDQKENDEYDELSLHALIQHKPSNDYAATVRLVTFEALGESGLFPIELHSKINQEGLAIINSLPRESIAEVSRFAVSKTFRKRILDSNYHGINELGEQRQLDSRRVIPHITLGLFKILFQMSHNAEIHYWYAVMEVTLIRLLRRFGFDFIRVGPVVDYHGKRVPCYINVADALANIKQVQPEVWYFITDNGKLKLEPQQTL